MDDMPVGTFEYVLYWEVILEFPKLICRFLPLRRGGGGCRSGGASGGSSSRQWELEAREINAKHTCRKTNCECVHEKRCREVASESYKL